MGMVEVTSSCLGIHFKRKMAVLSPAQTKFSFKLIPIWLKGKRELVDLIEDFECPSILLGIFSSVLYISAQSSKATGEKRDKN